MGNCTACGGEEVLSRMLVIDTNLYDYECGLKKLQAESDDES